MRLYLRIRLQASRNMLFYEEFSIKDVATACGFSYPSVFSRAFLAQFGMSPREFRDTLRRGQSQTYRPEVRRLSIAPPTGEVREAPRSLVEHGPAKPARGRAERKSPKG